MFLSAVLVIWFGYGVLGDTIGDDIWRSSELRDYNTCRKQFQWLTNEPIDETLEMNDVKIEPGNSLNGVRHWPNHVVPYELANGISRDKKMKIACAMLFFHENTCIKFEPRNGRNDYLYIQAPGGGGCYSITIGMYGGKHTINLANGCFRHGTVVHEMMHAIGFPHEQSRSDRDEYIDIHWDNIPGSWKSQFRIFSGTSPGQYDYGSVMHYGRKSWGNPSMSAKHSPIDQNNSKMGQRSQPTDKDIEKINALYQCENRPTRSTSQPTTTSEDALDCQDKNSDCPGWKEYCGNNKYVDKNCKKTCNTCGTTERATTQPTTRPTTTADGDCKDKDSRCTRWKSHCGKNEYVDQKCLKSCNKCGTTAEPTTTATTTKSTRKTTTTAESDCHDKNSGCPGWKEHCGNNQYVDKNCDKTCGKCNTTPKPTTTTTKRTTDGGGDCRDNNNSCPGWKKYCGSHDYVDKNCQKTCGKCSSTTTTEGPDGDCKDQSRACPGWAAEGACEKVKNRCRKSCNLC